MTHLCDSSVSSQLLNLWNTQQVVCLRGVVNNMNGLQELFENFRNNDIHSFRIFQDSDLDFSDADARIETEKSKILCSFFDKTLEE